MFRRALLCALVLTLVTAAPALASPRHHHNPRHHTMTSWSVGRDDRGDTEDDSSDDSSDSGNGDSTDATAPDAGVPSAAGGVVATGTAQSTTISLTGYSFQDNQGGNNATICCGVIHKTAGGIGTYADPTTVAVPGSGGQGMETSAGTRAYLPTVHKYVIVEDSGASKEGTRHFDMYVGGQGTSKAASDACMDKITASVPAQLNPPTGLLVHPGAITTSSGCNL